MTRLKCLSHVDTHDMNQVVRKAGDGEGDGEGINNRLVFDDPLFNSYKRHPNSQWRQEKQ